MGPAEAAFAMDEEQGQEISFAEGDHEAQDGVQEPAMPENQVLSHHNSLTMLAHSCLPVSTRSNTDFRMPSGAGCRGGQAA